MTLDWKLVVDCAGPLELADFWAAALGYEVEDNDALIERLVAAGAVGPDVWTHRHGRRMFRGLVAVRHPDDPVDPETGIGRGRRILFQAVPEPKTVKNRLHMDLHAGPERREEEVARLTTLGARVLRVVEEPGGTHVTMTDPEGNEFCVQ